MLHEIQGKQKWCGPAAIAAIAGITTDDAARRIREITGRRRVMATSIGDVTACLASLGYQVRQVRDVESNGQTLTLAAWLKHREHATAMYLVEVTRHWVVVSGRKIADSRHRVPVFLRAFQGRRRRVRRAWIVEKA